jgi:hypothetical protein
VRRLLLSIALAMEAAAARGDVTTPGHAPAPPRASQAVEAPMPDVPSPPSRCGDDPDGIYPVDGTMAAKVPLATTRLGLASVVNTNSQYCLTAIARGKGQPAILCLRGKAHDAKGWSLSPRQGLIEFPLDRADADLAAATFHLDRHDRRALWGGLTWRFTAPARARVGAHVPLALIIENHGDQRGLRFDASGYDHGFVCHVRRDGTELPARDRRTILDGVTFAIPRGGQGRAEESLEHFAAIDRPGRYVASCRYETELLLPSDDPTRSDLRWDFVPFGDVTIDVQP